MFKYDLRALEHGLTDGQRDRPAEVINILQLLVENVKKAKSASNL